ncbi:MAG: VWA domain-containing protein [Pirellulaceae bacterium]|nr:VWA domain-containing protein [Pirellulaceae bacterium]
MNFAHLTLLAGLAALAVPVVLHFLGRRQPQVIDFPALRFVRQTQMEHSRNWRLRHVLLLLLRMLLLAILAFALARPRVHSANLGSVVGIGGLVLLAALAGLAAAVARASQRPRGVWLSALLVALALLGSAAVWGLRTLQAGPALPSADSKAPVAAAVIIDTSPSMEYRAGNQTRLDAAKEMADWLIGRLPPDSQLGVLSDAPLGSLSQNPTGAANQVQLIQSTTPRVELLSRLRTAIDLVQANPLERKEVYLVTDLNVASWGTARPDLLSLVAASADRVLIQIIDVGVTDAVNRQLGDVQTDYYTLPIDSDATFRVPVAQVGGVTDAQETLTVELWQQTIDPRLPVINDGQLKTSSSQIVDRQVVSLTGAGAAEVSLSAKRLSEGVHHFSVRLDHSDPLTVDNQRFVTISVQKQQPTLIVADDPEIGRIMWLVLNPRDTGLNEDSSVSVVNFRQLSQVEWTKYSVLALYDPPSLADSVVDALHKRISDGAGLLLVLGPALESLSGALDNTPVGRLLPGQQTQLVSRAKSDRSAFWQPATLAHPVYHDLEVPAGDIAWQLMPIFRNWNFQRLHDNTQVLATLSTTQSPLLTVQPHGSGQIMTLTTPIPELEQPSRSVWNELWIADQFWWAYGILSGSLRTLSGGDQTSANFLAGQRVRLRNDTTLWPSRWDLFTPTAQRQALQSVDGWLDAGAHWPPGTYYLRGTLRVPVSRGFSINVPAADTTMKRIDSDTLDRLLGTGTYRVARERQQVESSVVQARYGQELFPLLMLFVAAIFLGEQVMSNRFYKIKLQFGKRTYRGSD